MGNSLGELNLDALERHLEGCICGEYHEWKALVQWSREAEVQLHALNADAERQEARLTDAGERIARLTRALGDIRSWSAAATPTTILDQADAALAEVRLTENAGSLKAGQK